MEPYDTTFFRKIRDGARRSAAAIAPVVHDLVAPATVIDVGCGTASFAAAFAALGASVKACDGAYAREGGLDVPESDFTAVDLADPDACRPLLPGRFDLAICLEVGEHLPEPSAAGLVRLLTSLSDIVLFSAAVPRQKGTNHINLQWPDYWSRLFAGAGYGCLDLLRPLFSYDAAVEPWYRQNMLLFITEPRYGAIFARAMALGLVEKALRTPAALRHPSFKASEFGPGAS